MKITTGSSAKVELAPGGDYIWICRTRVGGPCCEREGDVRVPVGQMVDRTCARCGAPINGWTAMAVKPDQKCAECDRGYPIHMAWCSVVRDK